MKILIAGASGALGRPLIKTLLKSGHQVTGLASRAESVSALEALGAEACLCDVLDREAVMTVFERGRPEIVIDQLSALPRDPFDLAQALPRDAHLRLTGGAHLLDASAQFGIEQYLQQSSGFYLQATSPASLATENSPFRTEAPGHVGQSSRMYAELEERPFTYTTFKTTALRYGFIYGPGTWYEKEGVFAGHLARKQVPLIGEANSVYSFVHVEDAALATQAAIEAAIEADGGRYNVTDSTPLSYARWLPAFAHWSGMPLPPHMSLQQGLTICGAETTYCENELSGASNEKARSRLGFSPRKAPWVNA